MYTALSLSMPAPDIIIGVPAFAWNPRVSLNIRTSDPATAALAFVLSPFNEGPPASAWSTSVPRIVLFNAVPARSAAPFQSRMILVNLLGTNFPRKSWST